jgi:hypothetical protein
MQRINACYIGTNMSLRSPDNPKEFRTALHTFYEEYAQGTVNFPRIRLVGNPDKVEGLPRKTRPIARTMIKAWNEIDAERATHRALVQFHRENPHDTLLNGTGNGMVIGNAGRNALDLTLFTPVEGGFATHSMLVGPRPVKEGFLREAKMELVDGRMVDAGIFTGDLQPDLEIPFTVGDVSVHITHFSAAPEQVV